MPGRAEITPELPGREAHHWRADTGAPTDIRAIAQTPDGYLWLGTASGLYRFDGISFEHIVPSTYNRRQSSLITALAVAADGALWVGHDFGGLSVWRNGRLTDLPPEIQSKGAVMAIATAPNGDVWVACLGSMGQQLRQYSRGQVHVHDTNDWLKPESIDHLLVAHDGSLWISQAVSVLHVPNGAARPEVVATKPVFTSSLVEDDHGQVWFAGRDGLHSLTGRPARIPIPDTPLRPGVFQHGQALFSDGRVLFAGYRDGLMAVPVQRAGPVMHIPERAATVMRDREGTIWTGGPDGLTRFGRTVLMRPALPGTPITGFALGGNPTMPLAVATDSGVFAIGKGEVRPILTVPGITALCAGQSGEVLVETEKGDRLLRGAIWQSIAKPFPLISANACAIGRDGRAWSVIGNAALYQLNGSRWQAQADLPPSQFIVSDQVSGAQGGIYANEPLHAVLHIADHKVVPIWQGDDIAVGFVRLIKVIGGHTYIGGQMGLARTEGNRIVAIEARSHPWLTGLTGVTLGPSDAWLITSAGIVRISRPDFEAAFRHPHQPIPHRLLGAAQNVHARSSVYWSANDAEVDAAGQPWFVTDQGLVGVDLAANAVNPMPPPVLIRGLQAGGVTYIGSRAELPAGTNRIAFEFAALSLTDPLHNRYRYRLEGVDGDWVEPGVTGDGARQEATYTQLRPGTYRFRVIAANGDGVWNQTGATMAVTIAAYFWQTWWFAGVLAIAASGALVAVFNWRARVTSAALRQRLADRMAVREHIARELHDTLLQGFYGLTLRFQSIKERLPQGHSTIADMEKALDRADDVLLEGRERVRMLRQESGPLDLVAHVSDLTPVILGDDLPWTLAVKGVPAPIWAEAAHEIGRIVREALCNIVRHARAGHVGITIDFTRDPIQIDIADDGTGLPDPVRRSGSAEGHYGLIGMRERAKGLGGSLEISNVAPHGTCVRLSVPRQIVHRALDDG